MGFCRGHCTIFACTTGITARMDLKSAVAGATSDFAMKTQRSAMHSAANVPLRRHGRFAALIAFAFLTLASRAHASMFQGETLDSIANGISWVVLVIAPIIGISAFWLVHILPEKIAHKKMHPQTRAIQCLCLLSLCFGGLLWPIAWLWAYTKPVLHKMAYGTDVDESLGHHGEEVTKEENEIEKLRARLAELEGKRSSHGVKA
jgi:Protein of unknown function (DUF3302)